MSGEINIICVFIVLMKCYSVYGLAKIAPEDVAAGLTVIYGFAPRLKIGNDHKVGFGFRFGEHADFQILYEFGPQTVTKSSPTVSKTRAVTYTKSVRKPRRRPFIEFLIRTGLLKEVKEVKEVKIRRCNSINTNNV